MFDRYTEKARRVIFFSRYEASQFASPYIETEHLLLGLIREDKALTLRVGFNPENINAEIEARSPRRTPTSTSVDLPLSNECKRILTYAGEEADALNHRHVGTEHLLLGVLREQDSFAAVLLKKHGVELERVRAEIKSGGTFGDARSAREGHRPQMTFLCGDRTVATGALGPLPRIGDAVAAIDGSRYRVRDVVYAYNFSSADEVRAIQQVVDPQKVRTSDQVAAIEEMRRHQPLMPLTITIHLDEEPRA